MREEVTIEINGKLVLVGYTSMVFPTAKDFQGKVFKQLRLQPLNLNEEGDVFHFCYQEKLKYGTSEGDWFLMPGLGFINPQSPLIDLYMSDKFSRLTTLDEMVDYVFRQHYWQD